MYVDNTKISHEDKNVVDWVISNIESKFGKITVTRGTKHTFVGIDIKFMKDGTVRLSMDEYIDECIKIYKDEIKWSASTPASGTLFDDNEGGDIEQLEESEAERFQHVTAKLLYAAKRVHIGIDLAVSFICTRVSSPTVGDSKN